VRRAAKTDRNQSEIVQALRDVGASVYSLSAVGDGIPDLLIGFRRSTYLLEVKDGKKKPSARELTPDQVKFHAEWFGGACVVVNSVPEALAAIGVEA
jgi:Holliday junction resolvase